MRQRILGVVLAAAILATAAPASAANKEHQQLMADLRMLQEQSQLLQNLIGSVADAVKAVNTRLDQQGETTRKAFADQKLVIDNLTNDVRVIREKLDDNNVRIGSLTQELDSLRQSMQQMSGRPSGTPESDPGAVAGTPPSTGGQPPVVGVSPQKLFETARGDYMAGQYDLAILGWEDYIKSFPKSDMADDAQVGICTAYVQDGKPDKAVTACDLAIRTYPTGDKIPEAYYRKGIALSNLKDINGARATWEELVKKYPGTQEAGLAQQGLERLPKRP
jgi:TolA-binding protein